MERTILISMKPESLRYPEGQLKFIVTVTAPLPTISFLGRHIPHASRPIYEANIYDKSLLL